MTEPSISLRIAESEEDRQAVYRFRYTIYVEQMQRRQTYADHARKIIREPLDEHGCIVAAFKGDQVVATLRANFMNDPTADYYRKLYRVDLFEGVPLDRMTMTTKLMVDPVFRGTAIPMKVMLYLPDAFHYPQQVLFDLIDCNKHLIPFFERFGWQSYIGWVCHREYGSVRPMFATLRDLEFLNKMRSPFVRIAVKHGGLQCPKSRELRQKLASS